MITLTHASRWYGQVIGINDVSCQIPPGITALLGPNGAGKSTLLKLITGQLRPTTGQVQVLGEQPFANTHVFRRLGYCPETESSFEDLTGREFVTLMGVMAGLPRPTLAGRVDECIELVGMTAARDRKIGGYSKGMRQRVKIAQAIIHDPDVLILDEPFNGLDPVGRREMSQLMHKLSEKGKCIVLSSHILYEVEQITQNILLMHRGRLRAQGNVYQIRALIDTHPHHIRIATAQARELAGELIRRPYILSARFDQSRAGEVEIETHEPDRFYAEFPEIVLASCFVVSSFDSPDNNLESVFRYLVGN